MSIFNVITLLGGLAMFLYGMRLMGDGLKESSSGTLKVAMEHVKRIDEERWCACARQGGRYLGTDMSAFADTRDDDLSFAVINEVDGRVE